MLKTTRWKPDTCNCEIEYEWDDALDENIKTHSIKTLHKNCGLHGKTLKEEVYISVLDENQRKNKFYAAILENIAGAVQEKVNNDGSVSKELKEGLKYEWSFDTDRNLEVRLVGFSAKDKNTAKTLANSLFGSMVKIK